MRNSDLFNVFCRVFGIFLALKLLVTLPQVSLAFQHSPSDYGLYSLIVFVVEAIVISLMLFAPSRIARLLIKNDSHVEEREGSWTLKDFQRTVFSALGMFFVILSVTQLTAILTSVQYVSNGFQSKFVLHDSIAVLVPQLVQLCLGLWLLFGAKGLWGLIRYARKAN